MPIAKVSINVAAPASPYKHLLEPKRNVLVYISHRFCTCHGDHVNLLIKTGSIQKQRMMTQTTFVIFKSVRGVKHSQNWWRCPNGGRFDS